MSSTHTDVPQAESDSDDRDPDDGPDLPKDTVFMLLKNRRRRDVLRYLKRNGGETTLDQLAEHIAARENDIDESRLSSAQRKRVYIGLYQAHLPKMDDADVIAFDKHRGTIRLRDEADQLVPYLEGDPEAADTARASYPLFAIALGVLVAAAWLDVYPIAVVPGWVWGLVTVGASTLVTLHMAYSG